MERGTVGIDNYLLPSNEQDPPLDLIGRDN
jgi:hypothetical protein